MSKMLNASEEKVEEEIVTSLYEGDSSLETHDIHTVINQTVNLPSTSNMSNDHPHSPRLTEDVSAETLGSPLPYATREPV